ncbi:uncharacterized protein LOC131246593 isoform X6 [Magnolia sinica]|uniref:uncharacterized protein LOC131246593 isoform X6 n=1 Tax=Magnolia sinica TaxID=86752 RepID=UPI002657FB36|nr:uncharacterized protein LOC131246593 isoform X6 [Magnolia sinica]
MHRSRSNSKISQDLNLRLGPSSPLNGEMFASNCARVFPDLITIEDDDDVEIFSQRPFVEELRLFPCPSLSVPILLEEDLELRLGPKVNSGFAGNQSYKRNISDDGTEDTSRTKNCFKIEGIGSFQY